MSVTHFVPDRKAHRRGQFTSRLDAFRRRVIVYVCLPCNEWLSDGLKVCPNCGSKAQHFPSKGEAKRYAHLKLRAGAGLISDLELQPAFPVKINGNLLCTYRADFRYTESGATIIEDYKGSKNGQDPTSKLRRKAAELFYGINVKIVTA